MSAAPKIDGRTARSERSKQAVARAGYEFLQEGVIRPTAADIAQRAGVSLRLVFHHFKDMEGLYTRIHELHWERIQSFIVLGVQNDDEYAARVRCFVDKRIELYEAVTAVRRATIVLSQDNGIIRESLAQFRAVKRAQTTWLFESELEGLEDRESRERGLLAATSWSTWETLRAQQELSLDDARSVFEKSIHTWLGQ